MGEALTGEKMKRLFTAGRECVSRCVRECVYRLLRKSSRHTVIFSCASEVPHISVGIAPFSETVLARR
jgi:hypothetical protein